MMKNQIAPVRPVGFPGRASSALMKIQNYQSLSPLPPLREGGREDRLAMTYIYSSVAV
jgi:hypothetical protein